MSRRPLLTVFLGALAIIVSACSTGGGETVTASTGPPFFAGQPPPTSIAPAATSQVGVWFHDPGHPPSTSTSTSTASVASSSTTSTPGPPPGPPPGLVRVLRHVPAGDDVEVLITIRALMSHLFAGPTAEELERGLVFVSNGFEGVGEIALDGGRVEVHLLGDCTVSDEEVTVFDHIRWTLHEVEGIDVVMVWDGHRRTADPLGDNDSPPGCLAPEPTPSTSTTTEA